MLARGVRPARLARSGARLHSSAVAAATAAAPHADAAAAAAAAADHTARIERIVASFRAPVRFALAYGSGVYRQRGYGPAQAPAPPAPTSDSAAAAASGSAAPPAATPASKPTTAAASGPMIDLILGVTHPEHWHSLNIRQNRQHYSSLANLGSGSISSIQDLGAGLYYNPDVVIEGARVKYGVISMERLLQDLNRWDSLYVAGRMQKPVLVLRDDARVRLATHSNLTNAVRTSLLMLPQQFSEEDLFLKIAGLSYQGDFRMRFGENPYKVFNIVYAQMDDFRKLYRPIIEEMPDVNYIADGVLQQEESIKLRGAMIQALPVVLRQRLNKLHLNYLAKVGKFGADRSEPRFSQSMAESPELAASVERGYLDRGLLAGFMKDRKSYSNPTGHIILTLCVLDLLDSAAFFVFSSLSSALLSLMLALNAMFLVVFEGSVDMIHKYEWFTIAATILFSAGMSVIPLFLQPILGVRMYGDANLWCWIVSVYSQYQIYFTFMWIRGVIVIAIIALGCIHYKLAKLGARMSLANSSNSWSNDLRKFVIGRLVAYLIAFIVTRLPTSVNRVTEIVAGSPIYEMSLFQAGFLPARGMFDFLANFLFSMWVWFRGIGTVTLS
nr:Mitochondrial translocator assembly and maintenance protein 41 [Polyrhizophydium stewartii]